MSDNYLTDSSCPHLASGIRNNWTLRTLILYKNNLEGPHFRDLMAALTTSRKEELMIRDNFWSEEAIGEIKKLKKLQPGMKVVH